MSDKMSYRIQIVPADAVRPGKTIDVPAEWVRLANRSLDRLVGAYRELMVAFQSCNWLGRAFKAQDLRGLRSSWNEFCDAENELYEQAVEHFNSNRTVIMKPQDAVSVSNSIINPDGLVGILCRLHGIMAVACCFFDDNIFGKLEGDEEEIHASNEEYAFTANFREILTKELKHLAL